MNMKKILSLFLTLGLLVISNSCRNNENSSSNLDSNQNEFYNEENFVYENKEVSETKLITYDGPSYLSEYEGIDVSVNNIDLFVYETRVNHERQFSWTLPSETAPVVIFDFEGIVHVEIDVKDTALESAIVKPLAYGIESSISGSVISFDLSYSGNYVVEYNGDSNNVVHIFANPIEDEPITLEMANNDDSIIYIGPGVYKADAIPVKDNCTIYLAGGAYVYGQIRAEGLNNITIRGRGIISGSIYNRRSESEYTIPIEMRYCDNVNIEGITFLDPAGWTIALYKSSNVTLNNVKMITSRQNGDGISVQSCTNVSVLGGFVRSWDDSLVVKNVDEESTSNVEFDGVIVWTDLAQSMEIGYEAHGESMNDITFNNITVLHNFHKAVISMHDADDAQIKDVKFTNITVEDCQSLGDNRNDNENDFLIDLCVLYNQDWSESTNILGTINNVEISNVKVYSILDSVISRINGYSPTSNISNVTIKGIEIEGKMINSISDLKLVNNEYTSNISVEKLDKVTGAKIKLPYKLNKDKALAKSQIEEKGNISQEGMLVPDFARSKGELPYIGISSHIESSIKATHSAGNKTSTPDDDGSGDFTNDGSNANNAIDNDTNTFWKSGTWKDVDDEFAALTIDFGNKLINVGVVRILGNQENEFYYTYSFQIWGRKVKSDGTVNDKYTRLIGLKDYEMSPGSNNCIDVNITSQNYAGIQIRFYRNDLDSSPLFYEVSEVEFYAPSLSYGKAIVASTTHNDVYNVEKVVDGDATGTSYYESSELPASIVVDLGDVYSISTIVLCLPPSLKWDARSEEIEILFSDSQLAYSDSTSFTSVVAKKSYLFDPQTGNRNIIEIDNVKARFVKIIISSNNIKAGYNAQLSEISIYGE